MVVKVSVRIAGREDKWQKKKMTSLKLSGLWGKNVKCTVVVDP